MSKAKSKAKSKKVDRIIYECPLVAFVRMSAGDSPVLTARQEAELMSSISKVLGRSCVSVGIQWGSRIDLEAEGEV